MSVALLASVSKLEDEHKDRISSFLAIGDVSMTKVPKALVAETPQIVVNAMVAEINEDHLLPGQGTATGACDDKYSHLSIDCFMASAGGKTMEEEEIISNRGYVRMSKGGYGGSKTVPMSRPGNMPAPRGGRELPKDENRLDYMAAGEAEWRGLWGNETFSWVKRKYLPQGAKVLPTMLIFDNNKISNG